MRFVAVWTLARGVLAAPEPLDENGQVLAAERLKRDEAASVDNRVVWRDGFEIRRPPQRVTPADVAWAKRILARAAS